MFQTSRVSAYGFQNLSIPQRLKSAQWDFFIRRKPVEGLSARIKALCKRFPLDVALMHREDAWAKAVVETWRRTGFEARKRDANLEALLIKNLDVEIDRHRRTKGWIGSTAHFVNCVEGLFKRIGPMPANLIDRGTGIPSVTTAFVEETMQPGFTYIDLPYERRGELKCVSLNQSIPKRFASDQSKAAVWDEIYGDEEEPSPSPSRRSNNEQIARDVAEILGLHVDDD